MSMPSLRSSPWIRGAPQPGFSITLVNQSFDERKIVVLRSDASDKTAKQNESDDHFRLADVHDKSVSRGQKLSRRASEKRGKEILQVPQLAFVPLGGGSSSIENQTTRGMNLLGNLHLELRRTVFLGGCGAGGR